LSSKWAPSVYFLFGQLGWFACVLGAAQGAPWIGVLVVIVLVAVHLGLVERPLEECKLLLSVLVMGGLWDSLLVNVGLLEYTSGMLVSWLAPYWIPALWLMFAAQVNVTYEWLKSRVWLAALLGAVAGPLSFRAGVSLGALRFVKPVLSVSALSLGWAVLLPLIILLSRRWNGVRAS
jgi:hypothetical protein